MREYRRLLGAASISTLGSYVTTIAYPLLALHLTGSPFTAGLVAFAANAPGIIFPLLAGVLVDRWNPKWTMTLSEAGRGAMIATAAIAIVSGTATLALLIAVAFIEGALEVFTGLAQQRITGSLVARDQLPSAQRSGETWTHAALVAGRPLGILLFEISPVIPFLFDVATFVCSVAIVSTISNNPFLTSSTFSASPGIRTGSFHCDIRQAFRRIREDKFAWPTIISFSIGTLIFQALIIIFLSTAHRQGFSSVVIGVTLAASGVGGLIGPLIATRLPKVARHSWVRSQVLIWTAGFALLAFPAVRSFFGYPLVMAVLGFSGALGNVVLRTHLAQHTDQKMLARVSSFILLAASVAAAAGPVLGGLLVQEIGMQLTMVCLFLCTPVMLLLCFRAPLTRPGVESSEPDADSNVAESRQPAMQPVFNCLWCPATSPHPRHLCAVRARGGEPGTGR